LTGAEKRILDKLRVIFAVEKAMERAIADCVPVEEIKAIIARKKRS